MPRWQDATTAERSGMMNESMLDPYAGQDVLEGERGPGPIDWRSVFREGERRMMYGLTPTMIAEILAASGGMGVRQPWARPPVRTEAARVKRPPELDAMNRRGRQRWLSPEEIEAMNRTAPEAQDLPEQQEPPQRVRWSEPSAVEREGMMRQLQNPEMKRRLMERLRR